MTNEAEPLPETLTEDPATGGGEDASGGQELEKEDEPTGRPDVVAPEDPKPETSCPSSDPPLIEDVADPGIEDEEEGKGGEAGETTAAKDEDDGDDDGDDGEDEIVKERLRMFATGKGQHSLPIQTILSIFLCEILIFISL